MSYALLAGIKFPIIDIRLNAGKLSVTASRRFDEPVTIPSGLHTVTVFGDDARGVWQQDAEIVGAQIEPDESFTLRLHQTILAVAS